MLLPENVKILPFTFFSPQNHYGLFFWGNARYLIVYKSYKKSQDSLHVPIYSAFKRWNILKLREIANTNIYEFVNFKPLNFKQPSLSKIICLNPECSTQH